MAEGAVTTSEGNGAPDGGSAGGLISSSEASGTPAASETLISSEGEAAGATDGGEASSSDGEGKGTAPGSDEAPSGAPEAYAAFDLAEGVQYSEAQMEGAKGIFKEINISQEDAQKLVNFQSEWATKLTQEHTDASAKALSTVQAGWTEQIRKDPDVGGTNLPGSQNLVKAALVNVTGGKELEEILVKFGLASHPTIFKYLVNVGNRLSSDGAARNSGGSGRDADTPDASGLTAKTRSFYEKPTEH
jgi:hypothetical protein